MHLIVFLYHQYSLYEDRCLLFLLNILIAFLYSNSLNKIFLILLIHHHNSFQKFFGGLVRPDSANPYLLELAYLIIYLYPYIVNL